MRKILVILMALALFVPAFAEQSAQIEDNGMAWEYALDTPESNNETADDTSSETSALPDGKAEYIIAVTDGTGAPIEGAMVQICDESTCLVAATDITGIVKHVADLYPYEIHLLMPPAGYASNSETYVLPKEGGMVEIVLEKQ